jgi:hypothetical protein
MLHARLAELERASETLPWASQSPLWRGGSASEELREALRAHGIEQRETESLAGAFARAIGITTQELRGCLLERAYGQSSKEELIR